MNTCAVCDRPLCQEARPLKFALLKIAFCKACSMTERATRILAGLADHKPVYLW